MTDTTTGAGNPSPLMWWRAYLSGLLLATLVACGGTAPLTQPPADPTATTAPRAAAPATGATTAAPGATATPGPTPTTPATAAPAATAPAATTTPSVTTTPRVSLATSAAAPIPTTAPPPPSAATTVPQPGGPVPAGWQVYRGPSAYPIVIAHPPDWTVDTSLFPDQSVIYLNGPSGEDTVEIVWGAEQTEANIDVLRDDFWHQKSEFCDKKGIEFTTHRQFSGATFATLGAACEQSNDLFYFLVASGLKGGDEWSFVMRTPYERKDAVGRDIFEPMLASLNIYAPLPT